MQSALKRRFSGKLRSEVLPSCLHRVRDVALTGFLHVLRIVLQRIDTLCAEMEVSKSVCWPKSERSMLRLLIPVVDSGGAVQAARHAAFLYLEHCVSEVELLEVLEPIDEGRAAAFHSRSALRRHEKHIMLDALIQTCSVLEDAGVPYKWKRVFGHGARAIAAYAAKTQPDVVVIDASHFGFFRRLTMLAGLWRVTTRPVTMVH
ncbi:nucleotide-binding universal stress UspA family protein [Paraburkholderia sp. MM5496-R1]